ncbi:MAG: hypothetical protein O3B41_10705 [Bacteroidetes bacterium]|nr:hypothetical protein [Bacteroidota bacterium]
MLVKRAATLAAFGMLGTLWMSRPAVAQVAGAGSGNGASSETAALLLKTSPLLHPSNSVVDELGWMNGAFSYKFGTSGWPDGFAPFGLDPNRIALKVGSIPMNDLITGRPRYDLVPLAWLSNLSVDPGLSVAGTLDSLVSTKPLTLIRYESSGSGSQAVRSLHVQNRVWGVGAERRTLQTAFGYAGEGATGEYDGSRLKRAREVAFRLGYRTTRWEFELFELAQRRSVGAHGGVIPFTGGSYSSIYQRLGASVDNESARRRTLRNDLTLQTSTHFAGMHARLTGLWTVQTLDFQGELAHEKVVLDKKGLQVEVSKPWKSQLASISLKTANTGYVKSLTTFDSDPTSQTKSSLLGSLSGRIRIFDYRLVAGPETADDRVWAHLNATVSGRKGPFEAALTLSHSGREWQWHERIGFGAAVLPAFTASQPVDQSVAAALSYRSNLISLSWTNQFNVNQNQLLVRQTTGATLSSVRSLVGSANSLVSSFVIGFRDQDRSGIWAQVNPVFRSASTNDDSDLARAWRRSLPSFWGSATLGWKATLFGGDLDLNTYVRARYWGDMGGLRLHTPTGLLVLPADNSRTLDSNWLLDFVAEAGIRGATVFLSFENAFSGTTVLFGNLIVPDYPLPQQRTRFGVFWPIFD